MKIEDLKKELKECFKTAVRNELNGIKHKGLLIKKPDIEEAKIYLEKAKRELELCDFYKAKGFDYKLPEEWYYILYYCALAILSKFGIESRSQKYTALFLQYAREIGLIDYHYKYIEKIIAYHKKGEESDVDKREEARYGTLIKIEKIDEIYNDTTKLCKDAISQAEEIIFSNKELTVPNELYK